jgi:hypothetical protein
MTQSEVVQKLLGQGFKRAHKHSDTVYLWKRVRPWHQVLAQVDPDGRVNGDDRYSLEYEKDNQSVVV